MAETIIYKTIPILTSIHSSVVFGASISENGSTVHNELSGRSAASCHPQSAITGLDTSLAAKANTAALGTVATSNDYTDLDNKPTIIPDAPSDGLQYARKDAAWSEVAASGGGASFWTVLTGCTTATTTTITTATDLTDSVNIGDFLKYKISDVYYFGCVKTITTSLITIFGESVSGTIQEISVGKSTIVGKTDLIVDPGQWADDADTTLIANDLLFKYYQQNGYALIGFIASTDEIDSGTVTTQASINCKDSSGNSIFSDVEIATADTKYYSVLSNPTYNRSSLGGLFEVAATIAAGSAPENDATNLSLLLIFVKTGL